jgi:hypothetical protein
MRSALKEEGTDPYPISNQPIGWDGNTIGLLVKVFKFSSEADALEFTLILLQCPRDPSLSLCIAEKGETLTVTIGFVKLNSPAANSLAEKINDLHETNHRRIHRTWWS